MSMDKLICVGKNYLAHAKELGDAVNEEPLYFIKPPSTVVEVPSEADVKWPPQGELHHEVELVLKIKKSGHRWTFSHYTIGLDMTLRDVQNRLKKAGQPWEKAKTFVNACVLGSWQPLTDLSTLLKQEFSLKVNGQLRQKTHGAEMRWDPDFLLNDIARWFPLREGDALFTGTPEGVGPIAGGDVLEVRGPDIHYQVRARRE
jgi:2-keto-4-pentenoate hydratase/2-oxohepta-3-ene-1,7-dioic acid hydratase in catechol pathway